MVNSLINSLLNLFCLLFVIFLFGFRRWVFINICIKKLYIFINKLVLIYRYNHRYIKSGFLNFFFVSLLLHSLIFVFRNYLFLFLKNSRVFLWNHMISELVHYSFFIYLLLLLALWFFLIKVKLWKHILYAFLVLINNWSIFGQLQNFIIMRFYGFQRLVIRAFQFIPIEEAEYIIAFIALRLLKLFVLVNGILSQLILFINILWLYTLYAKNLLLYINHKPQ